MRTWKNKRKVVFKTMRTIRNRGKPNRRLSADGATGRALTCESRGVFQNHALKHAHTLACTRKITIEEQNSPRSENRTRVSRPDLVLAARPEPSFARTAGNARRMELVRQGGSNNPKGGAEQEETGKEVSRRVSGRRGLERPPVGTTSSGSWYIRIRCYT
jgi:hypothetical protein